MELVPQVEACRICANLYESEDSLLDLFTPPEEGTQLELEFLLSELKSWQVKIEFNDGLPQRLCGNCFTKFCSIHVFKQECLEAQQRLLQAKQQCENNQTAQLQQLSLININASRLMAIDANQMLNEQTLPSLQAQTPAVTSVGGNHIINDTALTMQDDNVEIDCNQLLSDLPLPQQEITAECLEEFGINDFDANGNFAFYGNNNDLLINDKTAVVDDLSQSAALDLLVANNLPLETTDSITNVSCIETQCSNKTSTTTAHIFYPTNVANDNSLSYSTAAINKANLNTIQATSVTTANHNGQNMLANNNELINEDFEAVLQGCVIAKSAQQNNSKKTEEEEKTKVVCSVSVSDIIEEDVDMDVKTISVEAINLLEDQNNPLAGNPTACQYCYCSSSSSGDHLIFANSDELSQHYFDVHDPNLPYTCPICPETYRSAKIRDHHVNMAHNHANDHQKCKFCGKHMRNVQQHEQNCSHIGNWSCSHCNKLFKNCPLSRFRNHERKHTLSAKSVGKLHQCNFCSRTFSRKGLLQNHEKLHKSQLYHCPECKAIFPDNYELKRHMYQLHNGELPAKCALCLKGFVSKAFLQRHIQVFHCDKGISYNGQQLNTFNKCLTCGTIFNSLEKLQYHLKQPRDENGKCVTSHETNLNGQRLVLVNTSTSNNTTYIPSNSRLQREQQTTFNKCAHCPKRFQLNSELQQHIKCHEETLQRYICGQCEDICFNTLTALQQHIQEMHVNTSNAFKCDMCCKYFAYKKDLRAHMLLHTEMKFHCKDSNCSYACNSHKTLNKHIFAKHATMACEYCGETFNQPMLKVHLKTKHSHEILNDASTNIIAFNATMHSAATPVAEQQNFIVDNANGIQVDLVNLNTTQLLHLQEQNLHEFKPLDDMAHDGMSPYFFDSFLEPENEITVP